MLLPAAERRDELRFRVAKWLPYNWRLGLIGLLIAVGLVVQVLLEWFWIGVAVLLAASVLAIVKGYTNVVSDSALHKRQWRPCSMAEFERVLDVYERAKRWDRSWVDITCARGAGLLIAIAVVVGAVYFACESAALWDSPIYVLQDIFVVDVIVLLAPHWVTGVRTILKRNALIIKIRIYQSIAAEFEPIRRGDEELRPMLETAETADGHVPTDAKMMIHFHDTDPAFLGLQGQTAINNVQGTEYPYYYCVLIARPELGLLDRVDRMRVRVPGGIDVEESRQRGKDPVDVVIVRQHTTKKSGFHTRPSRARTIFRAALDMARAVTLKA